MPLIKINKLSKSFQDKKVLNEVSFYVQKGSFFAITGKSGCGKTTLLNILGKLEDPDSGEIIIDGKKLNEIRQKEYFANDVAFLFQNFALIERKTVKQNLTIIRKGARTEVTIEEALRKVGLEDKENCKVYKLSGGEQQRVALARVMMKKSKMILADEPTGSLDVENADLVMDVLRELVDHGKTVIMVTHDLTLIDKVDIAVKITESGLEMIKNIK